MDLAERIRKSRESVVEIGGHKLTIRRPTTADITSRPETSDAREHLQYWSQFVVGWDLTELDLYAGGTGAKAPFDRGAFFEWLSDREDDWEPVINAITGAYKRHKEKAEADAKN